MSMLETRYATLPASRADCVLLDERDPLREMRENFLLPPNLIYLGGNSLGPLSRAAAEQVEAMTRVQWGQGLLGSWDEAGWMEAPQRVGNKIGRLIGGQPGEVIVTDSTSVDLFKLLIGALRLREERHVILTEAENFPTDLYIAQGVADVLGAVELRVVPRAEVVDHLDESVAVMMITHVDFGSGHRHDMRRLTEAAQRAGALALWDLSHSTGAVPLDLAACNVDLALGCGYKYLNGGPGAPAFLYVPHRLQGAIRSPIWGWMGHASPFSFEGTYAPDSGMRQYLSGTPHMLSMAALEGGVDLWLEVDQATVWEKSAALSNLMIRLVDEQCAPYGVTIATPRNVNERGSHLTLRHEQAYRLMRALIDRGVEGDFRPPDLMRFAVTPLYLRFVDVWDAVGCLAEILRTRVFDDEKYPERTPVT